MTVPLGFVRTWTAVRDDILNRIRASGLSVESKAPVLNAIIGSVAMEISELEIRLADVVNLVSFEPVLSLRPSMRRLQRSPAPWKISK